MEKLELERMEVLLLPGQYFISSHLMLETRADDGSMSSFLLSFVWDGIRLLFCLWWGVSSQQSQLQLLLSSAQLKWGGTDERETEGFPICLPSKLFYS